MKFKYIGDGNEMLTHPKMIKLEKKGQIIDDQDDEALRQTLKEHQSFEPLESSKKTDKPKKGDKEWQTQNLPKQ